MNFITQNLMLIALALVSGGALLWPILLRGTSGVPDVSPSDAVLLINRENAVVIDVRTVAEFAQGHVTDSRNIPLDELDARLAELARYKDKPLLINCQTGARSASACSVLKKGGFSKLHKIEGGINAWVQAKLPLIKEV